MRPPKCPRGPRARVTGRGPPHTPPPPPEAAEALRASQDPARNRAAAAEGSRRRRRSAGPSFLNAGLLERSDNVACIASLPEGFWGHSTLSAIITNIAQISELSAAQKWRPPRDSRRLEVRPGPWPPRGAIGGWPGRNSSKLTGASWGDARLITRSNLQPARAMRILSASGT